jgi:hypothetical protein
VNDAVRELGESAELKAEISAWEDPQRAAPPGSAPVLAVDGFEKRIWAMADPAGARQADHWAHLLRQHQATIWNSVPAS